MIVDYFEISFDISTQKIVTLVNEVNVIECAALVALAYVEGVVEVMVEVVVVVVTVVLILVVSQYTKFL